MNKEPLGDALRFSWNEFNALLANQVTALVDCFKKIIDIFFNLKTVEQSYTWPWQRELLMA